jgi:hypothetical protein
VTQNLFRPLPEWDGGSSAVRQDGVSYEHNAPAKSFADFASGEIDTSAAYDPVLNRMAQKMRSKQERMDGAGKGLSADDSNEKFSMSFSEVYASIMDVLQYASQVMAYVLRGQNKAAEEQVNLVRRYADAKSKLTAVQGHIVPKDGDNPTLADAGLSKDDPDFVKVNDLLRELGMKEITLDSKKTDLESLSIDLTADQDKSASVQQMQQSKMNQNVGQVQANETQVSNLIKALGSLLMTVARNSAPN